MAQNLKPPPEFEFHSEDIAVRWHHWRSSMELYLDLCMKDETESDKSKVIRYLIGAKGREIFATFRFAEDGSDDSMVPKHVLDKFEQYVCPRINIICDRYKFNTRVQGWNETIDHFVLSLKILAKNCEYGEQSDQLIRDRIVCGVYSKEVQERLLCQDDLDLAKAVATCKDGEKRLQKLKHNGGP